MEIWNMTPRITAHLKKEVVTQYVEKFPASFGTKRFFIIT
jgi:hypothetical protein